MKFIWMMKRENINMNEKIFGFIKKVIYYNETNGFAVVLLQINFKDKEMEKYKDYLYSNTLSVTCLFDRKPIADEHYTFFGKFTESKYGIQLSAESFVRKKTNSLESVVTYLSSDLFSGIGKITANKVYESLGEDCIEKIRNDKSVLDSVDGLTETQKDILYKGIVDNSIREEIILDLTELGISLAMINRIINTLKEDSVKVVRSNPYELIKRVEGIGFSRADKIARSLGFPLDHPERLKALTLVLLDRFTRETGDSYVERNTLRQSMLELLYKEDDVTISSESLDEFYEKMVLEGELYIDEDNNVYDMQIYYSEINVASKLIKMLDNADIEENNKKEDINKIIDEIEEENKIIYNENQRKAILKALEEKVLIITGGPGTGKSTVIKGIIEGYIKLSGDMFKAEDIALLAPTGRASKRLAEVTKFHSQTIHKFLGYIGRGSFLRSSENPVTNKVIIVDEMSMVDITLASKLFESIPVDAKIIFVGDSDQLPSVSPGDVLCDLIDSKEINVVRLDKIHRQAESSTIVKLANCINAGILPENLLERQKDRNFIKLNDNVLVDNILKVVGRAVESGQSILKDIQILVPMYKGEVGIDIINDRIQERFNPFKDYEIKYHDRKYRVNDKVIQLINRTDKGVMNGDIGYIISLDIENEEVNGLTVLYDFGPVDYTKEELEEINLAYAISIHKSQGSEFKTVILPLSKKYFIMLRKKLLYTAVTRAKEFLIMLGDTEALKICTQRNEIKRKTKLVQRIKEGLNKNTLSPYDFM